MRDILSKILHIVDKRAILTSTVPALGCSIFSLLFQYHLATIGALEFVVVIDVYAQPTREKIKFYWTAS
jgi:hypothetical protein